MQQASKNNWFSVLNKFYAYSNVADIKSSYEAGDSELVDKMFSVFSGVEV